MSQLGQQHAVPQRNSNVRFSSVSRHEPCGLALRFGARSRY